MQTEMPDYTHIAIHPKSLRPAFLSAGGVSVSTPGQSRSRISDGRTARVQVSRLVELSCRAVTQMNCD